MIIGSDARKREWREGCTLSINFHGKSNRILGPYWMQEDVDDIQVWG